MAMGSFPKPTPVLVVLLLLLLAVVSFQTQTLVEARDSHFFSKVTRESPNPTVDVDAQQVKLEAKEEEEEDPAFLPQQTTNNAPYGLFSQQTELNSIPSTTDDDTKYHHQRVVPAFDNNKNAAAFYTTATNNVEALESTPSATKNYSPELQGVGEYRTGESYFHSRKKKEEGGYSYFNGEKQGMSDTRFLENGRYFHDINNEKPIAHYNYNYGSYNHQQQQQQQQQVRPTTEYGRRPAEYFNNNGLYSGSTDAYYNTIGVGGAAEQTLQEEDEFDP